MPRARARNVCSWCCRGTDVVQGGELIQVRYFLYRVGRVEHSHTFCRFHHSNRAPIHLRDVKKWMMSDAKGTVMPQCYAWSYKRRYRTGYVWHDVLDDDVVAPISNNEYVLKGSAISSSPSAYCPCVDIETPSTPQVEARKKARDVEEKGDILIGRLTAALEVDVEEDGLEEGLRRKSSQRSMSSSPSSSKGSQGSWSIRDVSVESWGISWSDAPDQRQSDSGKKNRKNWKKEIEFAEQNKVTTPHKPLAEPICSQCGKTFKPEKLHNHMQSCRGMKALAKGSERPASTTTEDKRSQGENVRPRFLAITTV